MRSRLLLTTIALLAAACSSTADEPAAPADSGAASSIPAATGTEDASPPAGDDALLDTDTARLSSGAVAAVDSTCVHDFDDGSRLLSLVLDDDPATVIELQSTFVESGVHRVDRMSVQRTTGARTERYWLWDDAQLFLDEGFVTGGVYELVSWTGARETVDFVVDGRVMDDCGESAIMDGNGQLTRVGTPEPEVLGISGLCLTGPGPRVTLRGWASDPEAGTSEATMTVDVADDALTLLDFEGAGFSFSGEARLEWRDGLYESTEPIAGGFSGGNARFDVLLIEPDFRGPCRP